ncbi:DoxX family protein [Paludibaculum fermentans]|uniref:DoxX family protein n=1 Tax=Paludibaculum fermentans TaxID=1473598 RepID=UPI003EBDBBA2
MLELGSILQRLFSTFPNSWPGLGLLLLRLCLAFALLKFAIADVPNSPETSLAAQDLIAAVAGIFLIAGLWTPVMAVLVALDEASIALLDSPAPPGDQWIRLFVAILSVSLAMLGPGAWSIDARLFGRRRFDIDRIQTRKPQR